MNLIPLILRRILVLGLSMRLSVVPTMNVFFLIFARQMPKVTQSQMGPLHLPLPQYGRHRKESSVHGRRKNLNHAVNSEFFMKHLVWRPSMIPLRSWITKMPLEMLTTLPPTFKRQLIRTFDSDS